MNSCAHRELLFGLVFKSAYCFRKIGVSYRVRKILPFFVEFENKICVSKKFCKNYNYKWKKKNSIFEVQ